MKEKERESAREDKSFKFETDGKVKDVWFAVPCAAFGLLMRKLF